MPNQNEQPAQPEGVAVINGPEFLAKLFASQTDPNSDSPTVDHKTQQPSSENTKLLMSCATAADQAAGMLAKRTSCACPACATLLPLSKVQAFVTAETLRFAVTGNGAKLAELVAKVEELKAKQ